MATQATAERPYVESREVKFDFDLDNDTATFQRFIREHQITTILLDNDEIAEDWQEIPTDGLNRVVRRPCYMPHLQRIKDRHFYTDNERTFVIEVPLDELVQWDNVKGQDLAKRASENSMRYQQVFSDAVDQVLEAMQPTGAGAGDANQNHHIRIRDTVDILQEQRLAQQQLALNNANNPNNNNNNNNVIRNVYARDSQMDEDPEANNNNANNNNNLNGATEDFPPILMRRYELRILPFQRRGSLPPFAHQHHKEASAVVPPPALSLRQIRSANMGRLVTVQGMIVRSSDVKPSCQVATYSCDACGAEIYQVLSIHHREFLPAKACPSCIQQGRKGLNTLHLQTRGSKLTKFQELKLQELPHQVPMGHIPRSLNVLCRGELTRLASPGDVVTLDGVFLPQRLAESGFKAMKAGLISTTYIEAQNIIIHKKSYDESLLDTLCEDESNKLDSAVLEVATGEDPVGRLAASLAPEIFGHEDIKRSLLLQLVGGCTRTLPDGMRIRGDINICLMGDPGVAKSQLLKHVSTIAPRAVYTTGKGSSGVGLTAAVTKDMTTGDLALEGGALVLADRGICCIDEFDKMDEADRTAIHEVMEQQTVSIAKAGIIATLNARASVLAAANPLYGRYNRNKSLSENINLPNSLLSRFDLLFLVLDVADVDRDMALARHVTFVHQNEGTSQKQNDNTTEDESSKTVPPQVLREYIARSRKYRPVMPPDVAPYVVEAYVSLRMQQQKDGRRVSVKNAPSNDQTVMTARQLLSILRLSQALARLRFSDFVAREDVDEAIRLTHMSKSSLLDENNDNDKNNAGGQKRRTEDVMSRIFNIIRDYATVSGSTEVELKLCEAMVLRKGFTQQQLQSCLEEYEALQVIQINRTRTHVYFIDGL